MSTHGSIPMTPRRPVSRRDFLRPNTLGRQAGGARKPDAAVTGAFDLLRATRPAMGSTFEVRLPAHTPGALELASRALDRVDVLEAQMSIYRDDSELSILNATADRRPVRVERGLFDLLRLADEIAVETEGAYDAASGALSIAWGFVRGPKRVPNVEALAAARACSGRAHWRLDLERRTVAFDRHGVVVNLGGIGKGYAIDQAAEVARGHWFPTSALIHGGRSSLFALGRCPGASDGRWRVAVRNPFDPERPVGEVRLRDRAIGTSGAAFQSFEADGRVYGHILDPRSGVPAEPKAASVTVLAPSAAAADALSTAFYVLGPDASRPYLAAHPEVAVIFLLAGDDLTKPRLLAANLAEDAFEPTRGLLVENLWTTETA